MDRDRPSFGIGLDALGEVTATGLGPASAGAENTVEVRGWGVDIEAQEALERVAKVRRPDAGPVREADPAAELEDVRPSVGARLGKLGGKVGHERPTPGAAHPPIRDESVVRERGQPPAMET